MKRPNWWLLLVVFAVAGSSLTLRGAPIITSPPAASQRINEGDFAWFFVTAEGDESLAYRWKRNGVNLSDTPDFRISGATTDWLSIEPLLAGDSGTYTVVVTDTSGSITSSPALLTVLIPPQITNQPQSKIVAEGTNVTFSVRASGTEPLSYQWYSDDLFSIEIPGATNADLTITNVTADDAGTYAVQVNNETGIPDQSNPATLTVKVPPKIIEQLVIDPPVVLEGDEYVELSVVVDPASTEPLRFDWYHNGVYIDNAYANDSTYTIVHVTTAGEDYTVDANDAGTYYVRIVSPGIGTVQSSNAVLTVLVPPKIKTRPISQKVSTNNNVTFSVAVDPKSTPPFSYQWFFESDPGGAYGPIAIPGATSTNLTFPVTNMNQYGAYSCAISNLAYPDFADDMWTNTDDPDLTSDDAILTVVQETIRPLVLTVSPPQDTIWTEPTMTYRGTASDAAGVRIVQYFLATTGLITYAVTNVAQTTNNWTNWWATFPAALGTNKFEAWAFDTSGNSDLDFVKRFIRVVSDRVTLSNNPPAGGTISGMTNGQWLAINTNYTATASGNSAQGYAFTNWVWTTNGTTWITSTAPALNFTMKSNTTLQANFVDVAKPINVVTLPAPGQVLVNLAAQIQGEARDNVAVTSVWYQLNGSGWSVAASSNNWSNWVASVTALPGTNTFKSFAVDASGNLSVTNTVTFAAMDKFLLGISNDLRLKLDASPTFAYRVDANTSTNLQSTSWILVTNIPSQTAMPFYFRDPAATNKHRFYRALVQ